MRQIALPLFDSKVFSFSDVIVHPGISRSIELLESSLTEIPHSDPVSKRILLHGPSGSGKTMILRASVEYFKHVSPSIYGKCFFVSVEDHGTSEPTLKSLAQFDNEEFLSLIHI